MSALLQVRFSGRDINLDMAIWETIKDAKKEVIKILDLKKKNFDIKLKVRVLERDILFEDLTLMNLNNIKDLEYNGNRMVLYCELIRKEDKCTIM